MSCHQPTTLTLCTLFLFFVTVPFLTAEAAGTPDVSAVTLLYSTNVLGEFAPCG